MAIPLFFSFFFFNDTATTEIYTLSLHDALPIYKIEKLALVHQELHRPPVVLMSWGKGLLFKCVLERFSLRSEEHTSELQSLAYLVCRLLLEKKKKKQQIATPFIERDREPHHHHA